VKQLSMADLDELEAEAKAAGAAKTVAVVQELRARRIAGPSLTHVLNQFPNKES
jgi:hypothetical protein